MTSKHLYHIIYLSLIYFLLLNNIVALPLQHSNLKRLRNIRFMKSLLLFENRLKKSNLLQKSSSILGISSPWNAPSFVWEWAWKLHNFILPFLHKWDECKSKDSFLNLAVLWWKAISGNRIGSKLFDNFIAYDMLPSFTRWIVQFPLCWLYPNLHAQNVAMRSVFLDNALNKELDCNNKDPLINSDYKENITTNNNNNNNNSDSSRVRVIVLGAGFDTRSIRFLNKVSSNNNNNNNNNNVEYYEMDLPSVIQQKKLIFERFQSRRKKTYLLPNLLSVDLNDVKEVSNRLNDIGDNNKKYKKTIFLIEAVLIYLKEENIIPLLNNCIQYGSQTSEEVSLIFADRFPSVFIPSSDSNNEEADNCREEKEVKQFLQKLRLSLFDWLPKPGRARHMGIARYTSN